jgi:SAM-dependent methyltransferase
MRRMATRGPKAGGGSDGPTAKSALGRTKALIGDRAETVVRSGYLDALGAGDVRRSVSQVAMQSRLLPRVYEQLWRPVLFGAATLGLGEREEAMLMRELLDLERGDTVLDVACGPGNTLRRLVDRIGPTGLAVGVDAAPAMLQRAVKDTPASNVAYVRADGADLPFLDGAFDAVACFGALYLVERPFDVLDELVRVVAPEGKIAILTSCTRGPGLARPIVNVAAIGSGFRWFGPDEITGALEDHGFVEIRQEVRGVMQYVGARRP